MGIPLFQFHKFYLVTLSIYEYMYFWAHIPQNQHRLSLDLSITLHVQPVSILRDRYDIISTKPGLRTISKFPRLMASCVLSEMLARVQRKACSEYGWRYRTKILPPSASLSEVHPHFIHPVNPARYDGCVQGMIDTPTHGSLHRSRCWHRISKGMFNQREG